MLETLPWGRRWVLATGNQGKVEEFRAALTDLGLTLLSLRDIPHMPPVTEDGTSFWENAAKKARATRDFSNLPALADDSGLEVDALQGAPGVWSARFAGPGATDAENNQKLLQMLSQVPWEERTARFISVLVLAGPDGGEIHARGVWEGYVCFSPRGEGGFGYDPLFYIPARGCTAAELPLGEKNLLSHRSRALKALRERLLQLGGNGDGGL